MRIAVGNNLREKKEGIWPPFNLETQNKEVNIVKPSFPNQGFLYANIYQARNLIPSDSTGNSDPYAVIQCFGQ